VSIQIAPSAAQTINVGDTQPYTVNRVYENGTETTALAGVTWQSSNTRSPLSRPTRAGRGGAGCRGYRHGRGWGNDHHQRDLYPRRWQRTNRLGFARRDSTKPLPIGIRLNNPNDSIQVGDTETYTAYLNYDDGTSEVLATGVTFDHVE